MQFNGIGPFHASELARLRNVGDLLGLRVFLIWCVGTVPEPKIIREVKKMNVRLEIGKYVGATSRGIEKLLTRVPQLKREDVQQIPL